MKTVGVVCALTPVTNPTSTTVFKALLALKTRNPVVFAFHPSAQRCSALAARTVRDAAVAAGAPEHGVQWIENPSRPQERGPGGPASRAPGVRRAGRYHETNWSASSAQPT
jgi:acyl-CoA reductase-like NAD-dependent aldehyde dehydrogenase